MRLHRRRETRDLARLEALGMCFGSGGSSPPPPDPAVGEAAKQQAEIGKEALEFSKQQWAELQPWRDFQLEVGQQVAQSALTQMDTENQISQDYWNYLKDTFRPLEEQIVAEAKSYDTPDRRSAEAARAVSGVSSQFSTQQQNMGRDLARYGLRPEDADLKASRIAEAGLSAVAANDARRNVEAVGTARKLDAASLGRGLPANQATAAQLGLASGAAATGGAAASGQGVVSSAQLMQQGYNTAIGAQGSAGQMLLGQWNAGLQGWGMGEQASAQRSAGTGAAVGAGVGAAVGIAAIAI